MRRQAPCGCLFFWPGPFLVTDGDPDPVILKIRVCQTDSGPFCYPRILEPNCPLARAQLCHFLKCNLADP